MQRYLTYFLILGLFFPLISRAEIISKDVIKSYALYADIDYNMLSEVIRCESSFNTDIYGDHGEAYGLGQFHKQTFYAFVKDRGMSPDDYDYKNPLDQLAIMSWAFSQGNKYIRHWSCARHLGYAR